MLEQVGGTTFYLGSNTGLVNKYVDSSVVLGQTYYYAVCAYDEGDASQDIFPTENSKFIRRDNTGLIITDDNTGYITPGVRPAGYTPAAILEVQKSQPFIGTGSFNIEVVDDEAIKNNFKYKVVFQDSGAEGYTINWSLIDLQTPDTVFIPSINKEYIVAPLETIEIPSGNDTIYVNGLPFKLTGSSYTAPYDSLVTRSELFSGNTPIRHGFRLQILNDKVIKLDTEKSGFFNIIGAEGTITFNVPKSSSNPQNNGVSLPSDYSIEFYPEIVDTSVEFRLYPPNNPLNFFPAEPVNFKIKNLTQNRYIDFFYRKSGTISTTYSIYFRELINTNMVSTWKLDIYYTSPNIPLPIGGTLDLYTKKPFNGNDFITFTTSGAIINKDLASSELDKIKVVPNPYVVTHQGESRLLSTQTSGRGEREIRFTYIPPGTKISIFTVRGELIKTLYHDDLYVGDVYWNLRTEENLDVAYGVYVFVVEAPEIGSKIGKFALIK
ncbi:MAG: hypothetical protein RBR74_01835 [Ignavibacteriaceae bacterium]|nr:hypothetical protein [Ignavibacteriaceae bacterium]